MRLIERKVTQMQRGNENVELLEKALSYWKGHLSVHDVLASELAYSLIYDNIRPDKVQEAMSTVGLSALPSRFFLIQVDDYHNYATKLRFTQEFFQKTSLLNLLRERMAEKKIAGFAANQVGQEKIICFLCTDEHGEDEQADEAFLLALAEDFKQCIRAASPYTISVCISRHCGRLSHYSQMYPAMSIALSRCYFSGKEMSILLREVETQAERAEEARSSPECYAEFLAAIMRRDPQRMERSVQAMFDAQCDPQKARLELIRMIQRTEEYCICCGVPANILRRYDDEVISRVLTCNYVADVILCFRDYYEKVSDAMNEYANNKGLVFTAPVYEYVTEHYSEDIQLGEVASAMGFSEGYFSRCFRSKFGMSFVDYLTQFRIDEAKKLLVRTDLSIENIAYRVGFNNYSYFCTCFKKKCGMTPGAYRRSAEREGLQENAFLPKGQDFEI